MVVLGDGAVGKTCSLISYTEGKFPYEYIPTVFDNYETSMVVEGREIRYSLSDTAGGEGYARIRTLSYPGTDIFLLMFSLANRPSFINVRERWLVEIRHHCPSVPILLIGNKRDLLDDDICYEWLVERDGLVTSEEGLEMAEQIGAVGYLECSAVTREGLKEVYNTAAGYVLKQSVPLCPPPKSRGLRKAILSFFGH